MRQNLFKLLETEFKVYDILIDVGCGPLWDLICFESSPFKKLIGIDNNFLTNSFGDYRRLKTKDLHLNQEQLDKYCKELFYFFFERYEIREIDFQDFDFGINTNSFIICNKVLHFYNDNRKFEIIDKFHLSLQKDGLMFLKINHCFHPDNTNLNEMIKIDSNVYQNKNVPADIRYLVAPDKFLNSLLEKYSLVKTYTCIDSKTLTVVIRK